MNKGTLTDWLTDDWLTVWPTNSLTGWSITRLTSRSTNWLTDRLTVWPSDLLTVRSTDPPTRRPTDWHDRLNDWLIDELLIDCLMDWRIDGWLTDWLTEGWLTGWLTDWLMNDFVSVCLRHTDRQISDSPAGWSINSLINILYSAWCYGFIMI